MNPLHLLWIIPLTIVIVVAVAIVYIGLEATRGRD